MADTPVVEAENVRVQFGGVVAVRDVSLAVRAGERIGLIGPNGAGKTSLVNSLSGEIRPTSGRVLLGGVDVSRAAPHRHFRHGLSRTFQVAHPFPALTVIDSVMLGPLSAGSSVAEAAERGYDALAALGLDDVSDKEMSDLNPVTAKLVELARIIAAEPKVVLLDELLAGLLPAERRQVLDKLIEISESRSWATVMIEHLIGDVRRFCTRLAVLVDGTLIADGPTAEVLADPAVIAAYLGETSTKEGS
ncbi:ABC transporter ATP-binding protein [Pseudonocardia ailaonensis]|uniref:ABC transporter ATP-binding protein n=1 Tax=Pseudonocardia ailaonensis TaxID=367279 RepID=A0ABN2N9F3_9PSEU